MILKPCPFCGRTAHISELKQAAKAGGFEACSVCGATQLKTINTYYGKATKLWVKTNYCPNCGAKMDLEESE